MIRQGDVLLLPAGGLPADNRPRAHGRGGLVLAEGEATGHAHTVRDGVAQLYDAWDSERHAAELFVEVLEPCTLTHEEHAAIPLPRGLYRVVRQREYVDPSGRWTGLEGRNGGQAWPTRLVED